ncbi:MAG: hypothetical protein HY869_12130 [Chloroflexi bacterium]|nr:hypothetical protein [Chloroflexota bacterium]
MKNLFPTFFLLFLFMVMLWARKRKWITDNNIEWLANTVTILAFLLAVYMFVYPPTANPNETPDAPLPTQPVTEIVTAVLPIPSEDANLSPEPAISINAPLLFFSDSFDSDVIDEKLWNIKYEGLLQQNGSLNAKLENNGDGFITQALEAKTQPAQFSIIEFKAVITNGTINGVLGIDTNCSADDTVLNFEIRPGNNLTGYYVEGNNQIQLDWDAISSSEQVYVVRLVQDGEVVRAYVNDVELSQPYPCSSMGNWLVIGAGASPDSFIEGYFEYIKLYSE